MATSTLATLAIFTLALVSVQNSHSALLDVDLDKCRVADCGKTGPEFLKPRIIGGRLARKDEFPFHVAISFINPPHDKNIVCGGNMLNDRWIMTTANCIKHKDLRWQNFRVSVGILNFEEKHENDIELAGVWFHPEFREGMDFHNIALVKTAKSIRESSKHFVNPICLPFEDLDSKEVKVAIVTGFGDTDERFGRPSDKLLTTTLDIQPDSLCDRKYRTFIPPTMMCAGDLRGRNDTCSGDVGGPLAIKNDQGSYVLKGLTAFGNGCAMYGTPGVYMNVTHYLEWTCETMLNNGLE